MIKAGLKIILLLLLATSLLFSGVVGFLSLSKLLNDADAVVVASVAQSAVADNGVSIDLNVRRTLKGNAQANSVIHVTWLTASSISALQSKYFLGTTGVWFLMERDSSWNVVPLVSGDIQLRDLCIPVPRAEFGNTPYAANASVSEKLIQELVAAAKDPTTADKVQNALLVADRRLGSAPLAAAFVELSMSPNIAVKVEGVSGLLRTSSPGAASALVTLNLKELTTNAQDKLARGLCWYRDSDTTQLSLVESLTDSAYPLKLRACAVHALREIHTMPVLPTLRKMLDDDNSKIRYDAVIGIAQFAVGLPAAETQDKHLLLSTFKPRPDLPDSIRKHFPTESVFDANEQEYISFWKDLLLKQNIQ